MNEDDTRRDELAIPRPPNSEHQEMAAVLSRDHLAVARTSIGKEPSQGQEMATFFPGSEFTPDQLAQLSDAEARPVDISDPDAPELPAEAWAAGLAARRRRLERPRKEAISIRLDVDVLAWFRRQGPGYQREINRLLRERMDTMGGH